MIKAYDANKETRQTALIRLGKQGSTKNEAYFAYNWIANNSDDNNANIGFHGVDNVFTFYPNRSITKNPLTITGQTLTMSNANPIIYMNGGQLLNFE